MNSLPLWFSLFTLFASAANRAAFDSCSKSSYCIPTARNIGQWNWINTSLHLQENHKLVATFERVCAESRQPCSTAECLCSAPSQPPHPDPVGHPTFDVIPPGEQGVSEELYQTPQLTVIMEVVSSSAEGKCALRVSGSSNHTDHYQVDETVFEGTPCLGVDMSRPPGENFVIIRNQGRLIAALDMGLPRIVLYNNDQIVSQVTGFTLTDASYGFRVDFANVRSQHGLAEHTVPFELPTKFRRPEDADEWFRFYNADVFEYELESPMAMYASLPWLMTVHNMTGLSGILSLQPSELYVRLLDFTKDHDQTLQWDRSAAVVGEYGKFDIVLYTDSADSGLTGLVSQLTENTGRAPLPPTAALGLHQARWNYDSDSDVEYVSSSYLKHEIPLDYIWLDIDHSDGRRYFTWNENFREPASLRKTLLERHQNLVVIVDPHVKADPGYKLYEALKRNNLLVKDEYEGDFRGWCWPGDSVYPDTVYGGDALATVYKDFFAKWPELYSVGQTSACPKTWSNDPLRCQLLSRDVINVGVWIDMNEPSVFNGKQVTMDKNVRHAHTIHGKVHNVYGLYYAKTIFNALKRARPIERPFVLTRSGFIGSQKYGALWTGDNSASWEHLKKSIPMVLTLALSGYSFVGADVGGFFGEPTTLLKYKWLEVGIWYPFFRIHSTLGSTRREIYTARHSTVNGKSFLDAARELLDLRYSLMPFWANVMYEHSTNGRPAWTSINDFELRRNASEISVGDVLSEAFIVGDTFLVHPDLRRHPEDPIKVALPNVRAVNWYHYPSFLPHDKLDPYGVFIKDSAVLFTKQVPRLNVEAQRYDPLSLTVVLPSNHTSEFCGGVIFDDMKTVKPSEWRNVCVTPDVTGWRVRMQGELVPRGSYGTLISSLGVKGSTAKRILLTKDGETVELNAAEGWYPLEIDLAENVWDITIEV